MVCHTIQLNTYLQTYRHLKFDFQTFFEGFIYCGQYYMLRLLGMLQRNLRHAPRKIKTLAYQTLVRPKLEYAASVWDPHTSIQTQKIEKVQRRAARFVCNNYRQTASVSGMIEDLGWTPLSTRRYQGRMTMMFKIIHGLVAIPNSHITDYNPNTHRHSHTYTLHRIQTRTQYYTNSFFPMSIIQWNSLPNYVVLARDVDAFKTAIHMHTKS